MDLKLRNSTLAILALTSFLAQPVYGKIIAQSSSERTDAEVAIEQVEPANFVGSYYGNINYENYETAWEMLSPSLQRDSFRHPQGYTSYLSWWQTVKLVEGDVTLKERNDNSAIVDANIKYVMESGREVPSLVRVYLLWDYQKSNWQIDNTVSL